MSGTSCIFCGILSGQLPAAFVHENESFVAFADIAPKAEHHILVLPREHFDSLEHWIEEDGDSSAMLAFIREVARGAGIDGRFRLITNVGAEAGQSVQHLHWHLMAGAGLPGFE